MFSFPCPHLVRLVLCVSVIGGIATAQSSYTHTHSLSVGTQASAVEVVDVDQDGTNELVVAETLMDTVSVLQQNNGTWSVLQTMNVGLGPLAIAIDDFNGNGYPDLAVANGFGGTISVLLNDGTGTYGVAQSVPCGLGPMALSTGDFDGDGDADIMSANFESSTVTAIGNIGGGVMAFALNFPVGFNPTSIRHADLDSDGDLDAVISMAALHGVAIYQNIGSTFQLDSFYTTGLFPMDVLIEDVNFDTRPDIVTANAGTDDVSVLLNLGQRLFGTAVNYPVGEAPVRLEKLNADNALGIDIVVAGFDSHDLNVLHNDGRGSFLSPTRLFFGTTCPGVAVGDLDGDMNDDLVACAMGQSQLEVYVSVASSTPYPGTGEDLEIKTGVNTTATTTGVGNYVKCAAMSDVVHIDFWSPNGGLAGNSSILLAQPMLVGFPPLPSFPNLHINGFGFGSVMIDQGHMPVSGLSYSFQLLPGFEGLAIMLQGLAFSPMAANSIMATTDGHELRIEPY